MSLNQPTKTMTIDEAKLIALEFTSYLLNTPEEMQRFCDLTGLHTQEIKNSVQDIHFQSSTLAYLMENESLLLSFTAQANIAPENIGLAAHILENA